MSTLEVMPSVLFVDDDLATLQTLTRSLERNGAQFRIITAGSAEEGLRIFRDNIPPVCILDLELHRGQGPESGLRLLSELMLEAEPPRVIILTGHNEEQYGLEALTRGASSFLAKPFDALHLKILIEDALRVVALKQAKKELEDQLVSHLPGLELHARSKSMKKVLSELRFAATTPQPVLLLGETGTGKGVLAHALHLLTNPSKPFIRAQPSYGNFDLVQSELFGHERGSFTGATAERKGLLEEADKGTLFLDELDSLPHETQVMLLHALQEGVFRRVGGTRERQSKFRLIAASNRSLVDFKASIRQDLYHRLSHHLITVPPLRERTEDIQSIATGILDEMHRNHRTRVISLSAEALGRLKAYPWPGNVRELRAVVEQAVYRARFASRAIVEAEDIHLQIKDIPFGNTFREQVERFERSLLLNVLRQSGGNISETARNLGLDRTQLKRMLKRFELS